MLVLALVFLLSRGALQMRSLQRGAIRLLAINCLSPEIEVVVHLPHGLEMGLTSSAGVDIRVVLASGWPRIFKSTDLFWANCF